MPLTSTQRKVLKEIKATIGGYLRPHKNPLGTRCYRLMDAKHNPVINFRQGIISKLISKGYLDKAGSEVHLKF